MKHFTDFITFLVTQFTFLSAENSKAMKKIPVLLTIVSLAFIISCMGSLEKYKREPCKVLPNNRVFTALQENCVSCHRNDFKTKEDVCSRKALIIDAVSKGRMPKMGKLYVHYRETLIKWK